MKNKTNKLDFRPTRWNLHLQYFKYPFALSLIMLFPHDHCLAFPEYYKLVFSVTVSLYGFASPTPTSFQWLAAHRAFSDFSLLPKSSLLSFPYLWFFQTNIPPHSFISPSIHKPVRIWHLPWLILLTYDSRNVSKRKVFFMFYLISCNKHFIFISQLKMEPNSSLHYFLQFPLLSSLHLPFI